MTLIKKNTIFVLVSIFGIFWAALPFIADRGVMFLASEILIIITLSQAWNLLAGYVGFLSLGHHAFVGIGGYALFILSRDLPIHPYLAIPLSGLVTALIALFLAPILFRLRAVYFAVGMWVAAEIFRILTIRWEFVGGATGLPLFAARELDRQWMLPISYWIALIVALGTTFIVWLMVHGDFGLRLQALRDDELAARSIGVEPSRARLMMFTLSAGLVGMAGATSFLSALFITPSAAFDINWMVTIVFVTIIGGIGRLSVPFFGALLYFILRESLAFSSNWYLVSLGSTAILVMLFFPSGLAGLWDQLMSKINKKFKPESA